MAKSKDELDETKRLMGALVRMKPKPHEDMKLGKAKVKKKKVGRNKRG
jgi:hypothetical protein